MRPAPRKAIDRSALMRERREALVSSLRENLGVPQPAEKSPVSDEAAPVASPRSDVARSASVPVPRPAEQQPVSDPTAALVAQFESRKAAAERAEAAAAAREAAAVAKEAKLKAATTDPTTLIAELGWEAEEWNQFLATGERMTPEQKRYKEMQAKIAAQDAKLAQWEQAQQAQAQAAQTQAHIRDITSKMENFPVVAEFHSPKEVYDTALAISKAENNRFVSFDEVMTKLEAETTAKLQSKLKNSKIAAKLQVTGNKPQSEPAATKPTTLGRQTAPTSGAYKKPGPRDMASKKAEFLRKVALGQ